MFDYPEDKVLSKRWVGDGPYRVWQKPSAWSAVGRMGKMSIMIPFLAESFTYPEFKGYFANVQLDDFEKHRKER